MSSSSPGSAAPPPRRRGLVSLGWLVILGAVIGLLVTPAARSTTASPFPARVQEALDRLDAVSPASGGVSAQIVFVARRLDRRRSAVAGAIQQVLAAGGVAAGRGRGRPFDSQGGHPRPAAALRRSASTCRARSSRRALDALQETTAAAEEPGLKVAVGGNAFGSTACRSAPPSSSASASPSWCSSLTFGSLLAAGMNLLALVGMRRDGRTAAGVERRRALVERTHAGADDRPRGRHRLHAVHPLPPPDPARERHGSRGVRGAARHRRLRGGLRRPDRDHRAVASPSSASRSSPSWASAPPRRAVAVLVALTLLPALLGFGVPARASRPRSRRELGRAPNPAGRRPGWDGWSPAAR